LRQERPAVKCSELPSSGSMTEHLQMQDLRPYHVLSDELLKLQHDPLSVGHWSALPGREGIFGCLNSLLKLAFGYDRQPGHHLLCGLYAMKPCQKQCVEPVAL